MNLHWLRSHVSHERNIRNVITTFHVAEFVENRVPAIFVMDDDR